MATPPSPSPLLRTCALLALAAAVSCGSEPRQAESAAGGEPPPVDTGGAWAGNTFERNVVFLAPEGDSALIVPWLVAAHSRPDGVRRSSRGLLYRSGTWETFHDASWESAPTRVPWRILPYGSMRIMVGAEEKLERIVFEEGARSLHVVLGEAVVEWSGQRGETFRLGRGSLVLASQTVDGLVLDMARARRGEDLAGGGWALLASEDSLVVVLHAPEADGAGAAGGWRGWVRSDAGARRLPTLTVEWPETRSFEPARREVPARWRFTTAEGEVLATLEASRAELRTGEGTGPQLPVDALFPVTGTVRLDGAEYPVRGLVRHVQP